MKNFLPDDMNVFLQPKPDNGQSTSFDTEIIVELLKLVTINGRLSGYKVSNKLCTCVWLQGLMTDVLNYLVT